MARPFDVNFAPVRLPSQPQAPNPLGGSRVDSVMAGLQNLKRGPAAAPTASVYFSPAKRQFAIGSSIVDEHNEAGVLQAFQSMDGAPAASPGGDFQPVDATSFGAYVDRIANPDLGRRFGKNFESATAGMGELAGAGLRFVGAEDLGKSIQESGAQRRAELSPYEMGLEDIDGSRSRGVLDWFVGVVGQFGPSVVETAVTAALGAGVGALAGGGPNPLTAVGGALAALSGKQAVKQATLAAAKKYMAGETLEKVEKDILREQASLFAAAIDRNEAAVAAVAKLGRNPKTASSFGDDLTGGAGSLIPGEMAQDLTGATARGMAADYLKRGRNQAIIGGAASFSAANSYGMGVSDIYREGLDSGSPDRGTALLGGVPYALLDLLPEFLLARRVLGDVGTDAVKKLSNITSTRGKALELLKRGGKGGAVGAALEGGTEAAQEALLIAANPLVDWNSPEGISRLLNSFAAGAAIGGPIGSLANLKSSHAPVNLLKPTESVGIDRPDAPDTVPGTAVQPLAPSGYSGGGAYPLTPATPAAQPDGVISGEPVTAMPAPVPYGEFTEGLPNEQQAIGQQQYLPAPEEQYLPEGPDPFAATSAAGEAAPNMGYDQNNFPAPAPASGSYGWEAEAMLPPAPPSFPVDPNGQMQLFDPQVQRAPTRPSIEETLGAADPVQQGELFSDRFPIIQRTGNQLKDRLIQQKNAAITWLNSLEESDLARLEPVLGPIDELYQTLKVSRSPKAMLERMRSILEGARNHGVVIAKGKDGLIRKVAVKKATQPEEDPEPPKPKGTKANTLKKGRPTPTSTNIKIVAPLKAKPATKAEREMKAFLDDADEADKGKKSARDAIEFYANSTEQDDISPDVRKAAQEYLRDNVVEEKKKAPATNKVTSLGKLMAYLDEILANVDALNDTTKRLIAQGKIKALYKEAVLITPGGVSAVRGASYNRRVVGDYIASDGSLKVERNDEDQTYKIAAAADAPLGQFKRADDDGTIFSTIPHGRVKMFVKDFASRLNVRPKTHVFRNVGDLKASDPELFKRAKAARKAGDFETTNAVGYSFGDTIIIFSDYVRTEQQLRFVIAHEAIGHFGLRSILTPGELSRALNSIYSADHRVRVLVDRMVESRGISREEAIEEWLADFAAEIDTSLLKRIWAAIKTALNRLGITFDDDISRLIVAQSRRYIRDGIPGSFFSATTLQQHLMAMQQNADAGRFSADQYGKADLATATAASYETGYTVLRGFKDLPAFFREKQIRALYEGKKGGLAALSRAALETVQTLDNKATRSLGLQQVYQLFQGQSRAARAYLSDFNDMMKEYTHKIGTTARDRELAGKYLAHGALHKSKQADESLIESFDRLIQADEFHGNPVVMQEVRDALEKAGLTTADEFRAGISYTDSTGQTQTFKHDVDENSRAWKIYLEQRKVINESAIRLLLSNFEAAAYEHKATFSLVSQMGKYQFEARDREALRHILRMYNTLRLANMQLEGTLIKLSPESEARAEDFLNKVTMAFDREDILKQWEGEKGPADDDPRYTVPDEFKTAKFDSVKNSLRSLHEKGWTDDKRFKIQQRFRNLGILNAQVLDAERYAKRTILGSYVPFKRRGSLQVRVSAYIAEGKDAGKLVRLKDDIRGVMPYFREDDQAVANQLVNELDKIYGSGKVWELVDANGDKVKVTLKPERSVARQTEDFEGTTNYNEVVYVLQKLGIDITPQERERIVTVLTEQNSAARQNLQRTANPGWDTDVIRNNAEYLEMIAHVAAKRIYRHRLDDVMAQENLWLGDDQKLKALKALRDNETDPYAKARARREYDNYAYMYLHMKGSGHKVEIAGKQLDTLALGERYRDQAKELLHWYSSQTNISDSTEDHLQGPLAGRLKSAVVFAQLGGTVASAAINVVSLLTHSIPFAAFYNPANGAGMGFGVGTSVSNVFSALGNVGSWRLGEIDFLDKILKEKTWDKYNLTEDEVQFLADQTRTGALQAVMPDALLGTARGKIVSPRMQQAAQAWMSMFSYTEKLNRRVTAVAVYRLEKARAIAEGLKGKEIIDSATTAALDAVDKTQGEYGMFNRPKIARGNLFSYVFMYKMFPIITIQMMRRMPLKGQIAILAMLLMLSGVKGLPFADDIMDFIDTICQKLGIKIGSVEAELYKTFDAILPGAGNRAMRGLLDEWTGATFSTRFSLGNLIPMTGAFKAGADSYREVTDFLGPMFGGLSGFASSVGGMTSLAVDTLGGRPSSTSLIEILRSSPIALGRAIGDTLAYADSNAVTNQYGRVVSPGASPLLLVFRTLGFYPASATQANDFIRVGKQTRDYMIEVSKGFKDSYIKAAMSNGGKGDKDRMRQIANEVDAWNDAAEDSGLEIRNFETSVKKALKEARLPAGARFLKTTPLGMRDQVDELMSIYGAQ